MITLEQIHQLDQRVHNAVELIQKLRSENESLKLKLDGYEKRIEELQKLVSDYKEDQGEIEKGILKALDQLDALEDEIDSPEPSTQGVISQDAVTPVEPPEVEPDLTPSSNGDTEEDPNETPEQDEDSTSELDIF